MLVLECDDTAFVRATYINQARVHQGYHYPRSLSTAMKSANYFRRFNQDYSFCINRAFDPIYATSVFQKVDWGPLTVLREGVLFVGSRLLSGAMSIALVPVLM